jgi:hypothetical protein
MSVIDYVLFRKYPEMSLRSFYGSLLSLILLSQFASTLLAQELDESARTRLSDVINRPLSARAAALGNAFVAMSDDPNVLFSNPAALSTIVLRDSTKPNEIAVNYSHYVLDINEGSIVYEHSVPEGVLFAGNFAAGVQYFSGGTLTEANTTGEETGNFSSGDVALILAYSSAGANNLHYGIGAKVVSSSLVSGSSSGHDYGATWMAADLGLFYDYEPALMTFGFSVLNVGTEITTYSGIRESVGPNVQIGLSKRLERLPLTLHLAFHNLARDREGRNLFYALNDFSLGGEFVLGKVVRLRFGYENEKRHELKVPAGNGLAGFSMGVGLNIKNYQLDFGLNGQGPDFNSFLRFGLRTAF